MEDHQKEYLENSSSEDVIDLRKLFEAISNFFVRIWYLFIGVLIWFKGITFRNRYILITGILLGFGWGFYNTQSEAPYYEGSLIVSSKYLREEVVQNIVDDLNKSDTEGLAILLDLDTAVASQIEVGNFSAFPILDEDARIEVEKIKDLLVISKLEPSMQSLLTKSINDQMQSYEITVNTFEPDVLSQVVESMGNFCLHYPYVNERNEIDKLIAIQKKEKLIQESIKLDSLKKMMAKNLDARSKDTREGSNNVILAEGEAANPLNVFEQEIRFFNQIQAIDRALALNENFQVFKGSIQRTTPASPSFIDNSVRGIGFFLFVIYFIVFFTQINKYLNSVEKMQKEEHE